jgi:hypothetical protein
VLVLRACPRRFMAWSTRRYAMLLVFKFDFQVLISLTLITEVIELDHRISGISMCVQGLKEGRISERQIKQGLSPPLHQDSKARTALEYYP